MYDLRIDGASINMAEQRIELRSLRVSFRGDPRELRFTQARTHFDPTIDHSAKVELYRGGTLIFLGWITGRDLVGSPGEERIEYVATGPLARARDITVVHPERRIPLIVCNVPERDDDYDPSWANLTAGQIIDKLLESHQGELQRLGLSSAASGTGALNWVPLNVVFQETDLVAAIEDLVSDQDGVFWWYDPMGGWQFARVDQMSGGLTITLAQDAVLEDIVRETTEGVWTAARVVGRPKQETVMLRLSDGTLLKGWDEALEAAWTWDASYAAGLDDRGVPTSYSGSSITDTSKQWNTGQWAGGSIVLYDDTNNRTQTRSVSSNTTDTIWFSPSHSLARVDRYWVRDGRYGDSGKPTSVSQTSLSDNNKNWVTDQWKDGVVRLIDEQNGPTAVVRRVAGNSANTISWAWPHGLAQVDRYEVWPGGRSPMQYVWRRFVPADPKNRRLANLAEEPLELPAGAGIGALLYGRTRRPVLIVAHRNPNGLHGYFPVPAYIDSQDGSVYAAYPVVGLSSDDLSLITRGAAQEPDDVILVAPAYGVPMVSAYPPGGPPDAYSGSSVTIYDAGWTPGEWTGAPIDLWDDDGNLHQATVTGNSSDTVTFSPGHSLSKVADFQVYGGSGAQHGVRRVYQVFVEDYVGRTLKPVMDDAAELMAKSRWDLHRQISLPMATWYWFSGPALLNIAAPGKTTGLETAAVPVQAVEYEWGDGPLEATTIHASTDTRAWNGLGDWMAWLRTLSWVRVLSIREHTVMRTGVRLFGPSVESVNRLLMDLATIREPGGPPTEAVNRLMVEMSEVRDGRQARP